jgi:hypothetical protein
MPPPTPSSTSMSSAALRVSHRFMPPPALTTARADSLVA